MERIYISPEVEKICEDYSSNLFSGRPKNFKKPQTLLKDLAFTFLKKCRKRNRKKDKINWWKYYRYVMSILHNYDRILRLKPSEFESFWSNNFKFLSEEELKAKILDEIPFYEKIIRAMRYDEVRNREYAPYIRKLGIKTCVYCNAQYSLPTHGKGNNKADVTTYEIDHFYPKSLYPFLCTTFFNLVPSCGSCNRRKNDKQVKFCLFVEQNDQKSRFPFRIALNKKSVIKYLISTDKDVLDFELEADAEMLNSHKIFHLDAIYNEHKDIAEELVWKHRIYSSSYRLAVMKQFKNLFNMGDEECYRLLFGTYPESASIHKRPLSLFMRNISEQLDDLFDSDY